MVVVCMRKESVYIFFLVDIWDVDVVIYGFGWMFYMLVDIDEYVCEVLEVVFIGKFNLLIMGVLIVE